MANETKKIIVRKGLNVNVPNLEEGEFGFVTDTNQLLIGTSTTQNITLSKEGHTHTIGNITDLQTTLDGKASTTHSHIIANVTGLQDALDAKATPADVSTAVSNLVAAAPGTLDTLNELAAALGDDPNFATTITASIALKVNKADLAEEFAFDNTHYRIASDGNGFNSNDNTKFFFAKLRSITIDGTTYTGSVFQFINTFIQYEDFIIARNGTFDFPLNRNNTTWSAIGTTIFTPEGSANWETSVAGVHRITIIIKDPDITSANTNRIIVIEKI